MKYLLTLIIVLSIPACAKSQCCCACLPAGTHNQQYQASISSGHYSTVRTRLGNRTYFSVGLINITQMGRNEGEGDLGQKATTGGSGGGKKGPLRKLFGRRQ